MSEVQLLQLLNASLLLTLQLLAEIRDSDS